MDRVADVAAFGERLCVSDSLRCNVRIFDPTKPGLGRSLVLGGPGPATLAADGQTLWHVDFWAPGIFRSGTDRHGQLLDWGEKPFDGHCAGLAWDGRHLWALDERNKRICVIEKSRGAAQSYRWLSRALTVETDPLFVPQDGEKVLETRVVFRNSAALPLTVTGGFCVHTSVSAAPLRIDVEVPGKSTYVVNGVARAVTSKAFRDAAPLRFQWEAAYKPSGVDPVEFGALVDVPILPVHECPVAGRVVVDGKLNDWPSLPFQVNKPAQVLGSPHTHAGPKDCRFVFGVAADEKYLYVAVRVWDDKLHLDPDEPVWHQDGVEIRIDARDEPDRSLGRGQNEWSGLLPILVSPAAPGRGTVVWNKGSLPRGTILACHRNDGGHITEVAIPLVYFDEMQRGPFTKFRLNVAVDDFDGGSRGAQLWWRPDWRSEANVPGSGTFAVRRAILPK
jgi:hypothetical protein